MKRVVFWGVVIAIVLALSQCKSKSESKLTGVWQLKELQINGTTIQGNALGSWLWEFNEAGGYLTDVAGMREKGAYTYKDSLLTLSVKNKGNRPDQVYKVERLDSVELYLVSTEKHNKSSLHFIKRNVSEVAGDKD